MKKKLAVGILTGAILLGGAGTLTFAQVSDTGNGQGLLNFGQMKPYMEEMHPDLSTQELKQMYEACHSEGGIMDSNFENTMMNNF